MKIYLLPGLGYDCRIFEKLDLNDFELTLINWIETHKQESITDYAKRLAVKIAVDKEAKILIGHSLGGILAQEIATFIEIKKIILLSSVKSRKEIPFFFKVVKPLKLYKLFTKEFSIQTIKYWGPSNGFENQKEIDLFKSMVGGQSNKNLQWALKELSGWETPQVPRDTEILQIHGTKDKTFPINLILRPNIIIENGSHILLYKRAKKISQLIIKEISGMKSKENQQHLKDQENYWSQRYINQSTGWDLGSVSEPIRSYIDQLDNKEIKILVPGAGNGYEAEYLYRMGFKNTYIIDISEWPLLNFKRRIPEFPTEQIIHGNFFELDSQFDLIVEQTFFCSFPPIDNNREKYIRKMHELLNRDGKLVGLWFNIPFTGDLTKRPFGSTKPEYLRLFSPYFEVSVLEEAYNSVSDRAGQELFGILRKK